MTSGGGVRTLTLLFTDIEGSTKALRTVGDASYSALLETHLTLLRDALTAAAGVEHGNEGDALFYAFESPSAAVRGATAAQQALSRHAWPAGAELRARIGIHTGEVFLAGPEPRGLAVHQAARICSAAHGGQILVSDATVALLASSAEVGVRELGSYRLKDLADAVSLFQVDPDGVRTQFPRPRTLDVFAHNLPIQPTQLVGRALEIAEVRDLVCDNTTRLVSLTGPGGIGKTRLATHVAAEVVDLFPDGVWFVDLAPVRVADHVSHAIRTSIGVVDDATSLLDHLRDQRSLLVLDNFEQVLDARDVVADILRSAPNVKVVVTSRALLKIGGEREYPVPSLDIDAPALFMQSARLVDPQFDVTAADDDAIRSICARLEGLPLAIELAASRSKVLAPKELLERLDAGAVFGTDRSDVPERHRTIRHAIAWSYDLLEQEEQRALRQLAIFRGGCTLEAAEGLVVPERVIEILVDRSLVRREREPGAPVRFRLLDSIAEFATGELQAAGEEGDAWRRAASWFADYAERAEQGLRGPDQMAWLHALDREVDNLRAVLEWCTSPEGDARNGLRIVTSLDRFWRWRRQRDEVRPLIDGFLARSSEPTLERGRGLLLAGRYRLDPRFENLPYAGSRKSAEEVHPFMKEALAVARVVGDKRFTAEALMLEAKACKPLKDSEGKDRRAALEEALALAGDAGAEDLSLRIRGMTLRGWESFRNIFAEMNGTYLLDERVAEALSRGDELAAGELQTMGSQLIFSDRDGRKSTAAKASLVSARRFGNIEQEAEALLNLGKIEKSKNALEASRDHLLEADRLFADLESPKRGDSLHALAELALSAGQPAAADAFYEEGKRVARVGPERWKAKMIAFEQFATRSPGFFALAFTAAWIAIFASQTWTAMTLGVVATSGLTMSTRLRKLLHSYIDVRLRRGGRTPNFSIHLLTLAAFFVSSWLGGPRLAVTVVFAAMTYRAFRSMPDSFARVLGGLTAGATTVLAITAPTTAVLAAATLCIALNGFLTQRSSVAGRVGMAGWFLIRYWFSILTMSAFAADRGRSSFEPWLEWSEIVMPAGVVLVALSIAIEGGRFRVVAAPLAAGAVMVGLALRGVGDVGVLLPVGGVVFGVAFLLEWLLRRVPDAFIEFPAPETSTR
jgi:predicted ATPase/class 3 adenylate cyclase